MSGKRWRGACLALVGLMGWALASAGPARIGGGAPAFAAAQAADGPFAEAGEVEIGAPGYSWLELGQLGGSLSALQMHEGLLLTGRAGRLQLFDAARPDLPLGESERLGGEIEAIEVRGPRAYVATSRPAALWSLDISDAARPQSLGQIDLSQGGRRFSERVVGMLRVGDFLYVAPEFGLRVFGFDEAGRALPLTERMSTADGRALVQAGDRLILAIAENLLLSFDLADPLLGQSSPLQAIADGQSLSIAASADGRLLYGLITADFGGGGLLWLDVYDRLALDRGDWALLHRQLVEGMGWTVGGKLRLIGDRLYLLASGQDLERGEPDRHLMAEFALVDPSAPRAGARLWLGNAAGDMVEAEAGDALWVALGMDGLARMAIPAGGGLSLERSWPSPRPDLGLAADGSLAVVATGDGLMSLDLSRPQQPRALGVYAPAQFGPPLAERVVSLRLSGRRAQILYRLDGSAPGRRGLAVVDLTDPRHPRELGFFETPQNALGLELWGEHAILWDAVGLRLIDLSRPERPRELGAYLAAWTVASLALGNEVAYLGLSFGVNGGRIEMLALGDGSRPERIGFVEERVGSFTGDKVGSMLVVERRLYATGLNELATFDLADSRMPRLMARRHFGGSMVTPRLSWQAPYLYLSTVRERSEGFLDAGALPNLAVLRPGPGREMELLHEGDPYGPPLRVGALDLAQGAAGELLVLQPLPPPQVFLPALLDRAAFADGGDIEGILEIAGNE